MPEPMTTIRGRTLVLPDDHIDTDQIIPARFLTTTGRDGLVAFADWRGKPGCPFDDERAKDARVIVAGDDFGCGSSREHAAWALHGAGIRAVVSTSIADIFRSNAQNNGIVPVVVDETVQHWLFEHAWLQVEVDVEALQLRAKGMQPVSFELDAFARRCLLDGVDQLGYLLGKADCIQAFEESRS